LTPRSARERPGSGSSPELTTRAYIGLGSNLADPLSQISQALRALRNISGTTFHACSAVYRSRAMTDPAVLPATPQADYLNAVAAIDTCLGAEELLQALLDLETLQGRRRSGRRWEARCIDLDLLLFGELQLQTQSLTIPHPGLHCRPFVIHPLVEIAPGVLIPGFGTATQVAKIVSINSLTRVCRGSELPGSPDRAED